MHIINYFLGPALFGAIALPRVEENIDNIL
jgi:hypothetical protein